MYGDLYSASQIVGKSLWAKTKVPLKRLPLDSAPVVYTVDPGKNVGTVYSWLDYKPGARKNLYWMFYDENNDPYYAEMVEGRFSLTELIEQGAVSVKEQQQAEVQQNETTKAFIERLLKYAIGAAVIYGAAKVLIPEIFKATRSKKLAR